MKHGSLFSGIGGFDLAAEWMTWDNVFHCETNPFGRKVLNYYWPNSISHEDIKTTDFKPYEGKIDIISGGFPCQPYSLAGKRKGKEDDRHLWPYMLDAIRIIQPRWIVGENVHGIINWSGGLVFHEIQTDLETTGYEVFPFVLPACGTNAPHRRDRVWFVAHAGSKRVQKYESRIISNRDRYDSSEIWQKCQQSGGLGANGKEQTIANPNFNGQYGRYSQNEVHSSQGREHAQHDIGSTNFDASDAKFQGLQGENRPQGPIRFESGIRKSIPGFEHFPTQSPFCNGNDGISGGLDGITFSKWRNESIKAGGNAIVPQLAYKIFQAIEEYEKLD